MSSVDESLTQFALTFNFLRTQKAHLCKNPRYGSSARTTSCDIRIPMSRSIEHRSAAAFSKYSYHFFRTSAFLPFVIVACRLITSGFPSRFGVQMKEDVSVSRRLLRREVYPKVIV
jgi:hypothetical protein